MRVLLVAVLSVGLCLAAKPLEFPSFSIDDLNQGTVTSSDEYEWVNQPCSYLEAENVSAPYTTWQSSGHYNYRYQTCGANCTKPPPIGIRSSVALGGISCGSIELRADGSLHEWTIINQSPSSAPKIQVFDNAFFAVRTSTNQAHDDTLKFIPFKNYQTKKFADVFWRQLLNRNNGNMALVLQTHPASNLPGVQSLKYKGLHPVSQLTVEDSRLPLSNVSLTAFSTYFLHDMNSSATPAISFLFTASNPSKTQAVDTSFMFNLPFGIENRQGRDFIFTPVQSNYYDFSTPSETDVDCLHVCNDWPACQTWTFNEVDKSCLLSTTVNLNGYNTTKSSGLKGAWNVVRKGNLNCLTLDRPGNLPPNGDISLCTNMDSVTFGVDDNVNALWNTFASNGQFTFSGKGAMNVTGAISIKASIPPGQTVQVPMTLSWYYPNRDFGETVYGNWYKNLFKSSVDVADSILNGQKINMANQVAAINKLHEVFLGNQTDNGQSSVPVWLSDVLINSLSHIRSAMWFADGRWRQWEAYDCSNMDSVHNDGERHIPYIMFLPESTKNKMRGWAKSQLINGMIPEQLQSNCFTQHFGNKIDVPSGRVMSDVSSMFITYLLELLRWGNEQDFAKELYPNAKKAAQWHILSARSSGTLIRMVNTYDVLGQNAYDVCAYNSVFHLLAMRAAEELAKFMADEEFAAECRAVYNEGIEALDKYLWNSTAEYYNSYTPSIHNLSIPNPGALMTDTLYAQVLAHSVGLGDLVDRTKISKHLTAELDYNDTPYGMMVQTGRYPYPGPSQDNAIWMMGNPNWASTQIRLGTDVDEALGVAKKTLDRMRTILNDLWNVPGILGGIGYGADGQPFITSHYGYYMSSWHLILALSGQQANLPDGILTFEPKSQPPFNFPVMLPGVLGVVTARVGQDSTVTYAIKLSFGELSLQQLKVGESTYPGSVSIKTGQEISWKA
ncbi:hypothetical protein LOTGIDRAFT_161662 [Lottia gigantea]|uniref:Apple domain-containing protein n=1 Tax=Lottia gigantea TaxID=225164 RepID=V4AJ48_LOTGI|nr:hypothetical protein LOTGIDRAFT_161662 [Lottia gigantea]ESO93556.1 hypothetical protein LOTGIDRAFT_161662 [Lottia gigantea]